jgi:hypothetical protein
VLQDSLTIWSTPLQVLDAACGARAYTSSTGMLFADTPPLDRRCDGL